MNHDKDNGKPSLLHLQPPTSGCLFPNTLSLSYDTHTHVTVWAQGSPPFLSDCRKI